VCGFTQTISPQFHYISSKITTTIAAAAAANDDNDSDDDVDDDYYDDTFITFSFCFNLLDLYYR